MAKIEDVTRSASVLALILKDQGNIEKIKADPKVLTGLVEAAIDESDRLTSNAVQLEMKSADVKIYRYTIMFLGFTVMVIVSGGVISLFSNPGGSTPLPEALVALASTAVGALAGLLAPLGDRK